MYSGGCVQVISKHCVVFYVSILVSLWVLEPVPWEYPGMTVFTSAIKLVIGTSDYVFHPIIIMGLTNITFFHLSIYLSIYLSILQYQV
jgi:hypothetical protein